MRSHLLQLVLGTLLGVLLALIAAYLGEPNFKLLWETICQYYSLKS